MSILYYFKKKHKAAAQPAAEPVPVAFKTLEELMFSQFVTCMVEHDYAGIVKAGQPAPEAITRHWFKLLSEYYELIGSKEAVKYCKQIGKIEAVNVKISLVSQLIAALQAGYEPRLCDCLRDWGYNQPFTRESLVSDLARVNTELGNDKVRLQQLIKDFEHQQGEKGSDKVSKEYFMNLLYAIEEHRKVILNPDELSTYKFCLLYKQLADYSQQVKLKNRGHGRK